MKKILLSCLFFFFLFQCGPDCPPCPDSSGNLNIPAEHWVLLGCAGFAEYVREYVHCAFFQEIINDDNFVFGFPDCERNDIYIKKIGASYKSPIIFECSKIIHEVTHLKYHCIEDEHPPCEMEEEFYHYLDSNNCY